MPDRTDDPMMRDYTYGTGFGQRQGGWGQSGFGPRTGFGEPGWSEYPNETREYRGSFASPGESRGRFVGKGPKNYQRNDERIKEDVNEELTQHPDVDATEINVQVRNGEITLTGTVDDRQSKRIAEEIAERVSGVKDVQNQLRVTTGAASGQEFGQSSESGFKETERGKSRVGQSA